MLRVAGILLLSLCLLGASTQPAMGVSQARLDRILRALSDPDLRVRVQALVVLVRLKDRRAVSRVVRVLISDRSESCRALAAAALGAAGDSRAIAPLQRRLSDPSSRVRRQVRVALARLAPTKSTVGKDNGLKQKKARILVRLGSMGANVRRDRRLKTMLRGLWKAHVARSPAGIALFKGRARPSQKVYKVNSSITRFTRVRQGSVVQTTCTISVVVDHNGAIVMMTSGGATVEVSAGNFQQRDAQRVDRSVLETAVASAHRNVVTYLRRQ